MNLAITSTTVLLALILLVSKGSTQTQELLGQQLRLTGQWSEDRFKANRVRLWETEAGPRRGRVTGEIATVNADTRTLRIGPILVEWNEATKLEGFSIGDLTPGQVIEVSGQLAGPAHLIAQSIEPESLPPHLLEIRGTVTEAERRPDGSTYLTVLGVQVETPRGVAKNALRSGLTRRPDERRPAEQLTLTLLERPVTIGGELKAASEYKGNVSLTKNPKDDVLSLKQKLKLELLCP